MTKKFGLLKTKLKYYKNLLINSGFEKVNYLEIRKENDLSEITSKPEKARIFISANIEKIRLIDNLFVGKVKIQDKYFTNS